jgi:hypothetical protein
MPDTATFVAASIQMTGFNPEVEFTVWDESLPECHTGDLPEVTPSITQIAAVPERYEWHWNLP